MCATKPSPGSLVAVALSGSWRASSSPLQLSPKQLAEITPLLVRSGGAGLVWRRIRGSALQSLPSALDLQQAYRLHVLHATIHEEQIPRAMALLESAGVQPLLAKGWAAGRLYLEPGLRPYGDIDLYVRPEQHPSAQAVLANAHPLAGPVDLHRGFPELDDRSPEEIYARAQQVALDGVAVRIPGPEDHLRLLCLHLLRHGAARPLWLCDIGAAIESRPKDFDWDYFLSGSRRRTDYVVHTLGLAHRLLGARLDDTRVAERARNLPRWLLRDVLRQWGVGFQPREPITAYLRRPRGVLAELRRHWPNPVEATVGVGGPFNTMPRLPFQVAHCVARAARFVPGLPRSLWPARG